MEDCESFQAGKATNSTSGTDTASRLQGREQPPWGTVADSDALRSIASSLGRLADALAPEPPDIVGTPYAARRLGCTTVWIAELIRRGDIPKNCLVTGTGNGKPWKFYRKRIDQWIVSR